MKAFYIGKREYLPVLRLQERLFQEKIARQTKLRRGEGTITLLPEVNLLVEHASPVYTIGRRDTSEGLPPSIRSAAGVQKDPNSGADPNAPHTSPALNSSLPEGRIPAAVVKTKRGGGITYHGPGQVTMYPIANLQALWKVSTDSHKPRSPIEWFSAVLEKAMMGTAGLYGVPTHPFKTGIWANAFNGEDAKKMGSIGLQLGSNWVSMHGAGFNVSTDLSYFEQIVMCELPGRSATSLMAEIEKRSISFGALLPMNTSSTNETGENEVSSAPDTRMNASKNRTSGNGLSSLYSVPNDASIKTVVPLLHQQFVKHLHHPDSAAGNWNHIVDLSADDNWENTVYESLSITPCPASP